MVKSSGFSKLFIERSLWEVMRVFPRSFATPIVAGYLSLLTFSCTAAILLGGRFLQPLDRGQFPSPPNTYITDVHLVNFIKSLGGSGLTLGVGTLSVIIAGFAIFASGVDVQALRLLINNPKKMHGSKLGDATERPQLVFVYSIFIYAMSTFALLALTSLCALALADAESVPYNLIKNTFPKSLPVVLLLSASLLLAQIVFTLSILKSFIWNMYQVLLQMSALKVHVADRAAAERKSNALGEKPNGIPADAGGQG